MPRFQLRTLGYIAVILWALSSIILLPFPPQIIAAMDSERKVFEDAIIWQHERSSGTDDLAAKDYGESKTTTTVVWIKWLLTSAVVALGMISGLLMAFRKSVGKYLLLCASGIFAAGSVGRLLYEARGRGVSVDEAFFYLVKTVQRCEEVACQIYYSLLYLLIPSAHVLVIILLIFLLSSANIRGSQSRGQRSRS